MSTDPDANDVYDAEDRLDRWSDLGTVRVFGSTWVLEPEVRFARVEDVQRYVDAALARIGHPRPVRVRPRRGARRAHYEAGGVIAEPCPPSAAMRASIALFRSASVAQPGEW